MEIELEAYKTIREKGGIAKRRDIHFFFEYMDYNRVRGHVDVYSSNYF